MAISPQFALSPPGDEEPSKSSRDCVYSFDLHGNLIEMNATFAEITGYDRDQAARLNLSQLLDPESWQRSREQVLALLGGCGTQQLNLGAIRRDGQRIRMEVVRRLLFERGRPVAIQDAGHPLADVSEQSPRLLAELETDLSAGSEPVNRFAEQLKQLHRLSTTNYVTLGQAFEDHLRTGCQLFGLPIGLLLQVEGSRALIQASHGAPQFHPDATIPLRETRAHTIEGRLRTVTVSAPALPEGQLQPAFETYIGSPVWLGSELFATLSFSSPYTGVARAFSPADRELIELLTRSIGRMILEHGIQSERDRLQSLEKNRNLVLEMVAENEGLDLILAEVAHLVEQECPGALCSVLILKDEVLAWAAAPSFNAEAIRLFKPFRVLRGAAALPTAEVARSTVFWEDVRACPFWAERGHFAAQMGIVSCRSTPILSGEGVLLGILALHYKALHYKEGQSSDYSDTELLQVASRLAARALEQRGLNERLEFQARHDSLTGLPNRSYFMELLNAALREADAAERSGYLAVLFIDLDRFKQINDILGHAMGDRLLGEVGQRLKRLLTEDDLAGRMGGDEFIIVLTRQPDEQSAALASREFLEALRAPHQIEDNELFVTASIGVAIYPRHGKTVAELLRNADLAMYHAKNSGKNDVEVFRAEDHAASLERLRLENALRRALEHQEFELLYQPVVGMSGKVEGLEALLTWRHPIYGTISPKQFIPIAEEAGLIIDIGSWVIRRACLEAASWHKAGHSAARISVNVSALQFERRDFLETVADALALSNLPPDRLELELTESYIMKDLPQAAARFAQIRKLGISIAIDDFGTGYSSLSYLNKLPVDSLKIDQSFLHNLHEPEGSLAVIQSIVRMAHSMNLTVVAEGVETRAELDLVRVLGCDKVQGHVYGPARRREDVEALLAAHDSLGPLEA